MTQYNSSESGCTWVAYYDRGLDDAEALWATWEFTLMARTERLDERCFVWVQTTTPFSRVQMKQMLQATWIGSTGASEEFEYWFNPFNSWQFGYKGHVAMEAPTGMMPVGKILDEICNAADAVLLMPDYIRQTDEIVAMLERPELVRTQPRMYPAIPEADD